MKTKILFFFIITLWMNSISFSQSDYETFMSFKRECNKIATSIKNASSIEEFNLIREKIQYLKNEYTPNKILLDKALYPENFQSTFENIENAFEYKIKDFSQITSLTAQVVSLNSKLDELNKKNDELIIQIKNLQSKLEKDQAQIASLNQLISQLKGNIGQRDLLVRNLIDSLLSELIKLPEKISQKEAHLIISKVNKENLFYNIERTIKDNIQFLIVTRMTADDYGKVFKQYYAFNKLWKQINPRLSNVYLTKKQKKSEISKIDTLFRKWNSQIQTSIYNEIQNLFQEKNITLQTFNDANGFITSALNFIDSQMNNLDNNSNYQSEVTFHSFADSVYFKSVKTKWIPLLIENHLMTKDQKDILEEKIRTWQQEFVQKIPYWVIIGSTVLIFIIAFSIYKRKKKPMHNSN